MRLAVLLIASLAAFGADPSVSLDTAQGSAPVTGSVVKDADNSYKISTGDTDHTAKLAQDGDSMKGTLTGTNGSTGPVTGTWKVQAKLSSGRQYQGQIILRDQAGKLSGSLAVAEGEVGLANVKFAAPELCFDVPVEEGVYQVKLTLAGSELKGTVTGPGEVTGTVSASRQAPQ